MKVLRARRGVVVARGVVPKTKHLNQILLGNRQELCYNELEALSTGGKG